MVTTVLEITGAVVIVAGISAGVWVVVPFLWPVAVLVFGAGLIGVSALISWKGGRS